MHELTDVEKIWNRACSGSGKYPHAGDRALAGLLLFHGPAMNGGVLHAAECLSPAQLAEAQTGYRYFALGSVADLIIAAKNAIRLGHDIDAIEEEFDHKYSVEISGDGILVKSFESHLSAYPQEYSPLANE
jgi:hypothetical protein